MTVFRWIFAAVVVALVAFATLQSLRPHAAAPVPASRRSSSVSAFSRDAATVIAELPPAEAANLAEYLDPETAAQIFAKIRLPHALPLMFGGMKISITLAVIGTGVAALTVQPSVAAPIYVEETRTQPEQPNDSEAVRKVLAAGVEASGQVRGNTRWSADSTAVVRGYVIGQQ